MHGRAAQEMRYCMESPDCSWVLLVSTGPPLSRGVAMPYTERCTASQNKQGPDEEALLLCTKL